MTQPLSKVTRLRSLFPLLDIQVDGGIGPGHSIKAVAKAGANVIVAGTSIFSAGEPGEVIESLRETVRGAIVKRHTQGGQVEDVSSDTEDTLKQ